MPAARCLPPPDPRILDLPADPLGVLGSYSRPAHRQLTRGGLVASQPRVPSQPPAAAVGRQRMAGCGERIEPLIPEGGT